jgi:hypothetical protein
MSTVPTPVANIPAGTPPPRDDKVTVISHSNLFYWWPVWAVGFLMAALTYLDSDRLATVPPGTKAIKEIVTYKDKEGVEHRGEAYILPEPKNDKDVRNRVARLKRGDNTSVERDPYIHMSRNKNYGVIFCVTLLLVIVITNIPLRGMWSVVVIITVIMLSVIFALAGWWERIFTFVEYLDIRINAGGYLFISIGLFVIWLFTILIFDRQIYIEFEPGQFKVCTEIGGGETAYDTIGMTLERQRSDLFRHMILGLGSGDLIVRTSGAQAHQFALPNVLFISKKVQMIEDLLRRRKTGEGK